MQKNNQNQSNNNPTPLPLTSEQVYERQKKCNALNLYEICGKDLIRYRGDIDFTVKLVDGSVWIPTPTISVGTVFYVPWTPFEDCYKYSAFVWEDLSSNYGLLRRGMVYLAKV